MNRARLGLLLAALLATPTLARAQARTKAAAGGQAHGVVTKPPQVAHFVAPTVPDDVKLDQTATVELEIAIGVDGKVSEANVLTGSGIPELDDAAKAAALALEFEPAEIDGVPAPVRIKYKYEIQPPAPTQTVPDTAAFTGTVTDQKTKAPLAGVKIELDTGQSAITDDAGHFAIDGVTPGTHGVTLSGPTFTPIGTEETLEAGRRYEASYEVQVAAAAVPDEERADFEVVIVATKLGSKITSTEVTAEQGARVAGTGGDVAKVVENLPGVARSTVGSGAIVVWGAGAQDTRVYVDGVHIPVLYHEGGYRSVIHSDLVRSVELQPGGYGASYGRGLGGLITVGLKPLEEPGYHGSVQVDAIDSSASLRGSLNDKFHFGVAARKSYLDWVLARVTSEDVGDFVPIPKYWDAQARVSYTPDEDTSLELGTLFSYDTIDHNLGSSDPADIKREAKMTRFSRYYLHYVKKQGGDTTSIVPYVGFDETRVRDIFGTVPAELDNRTTVYGLRASYTTNPVPWIAFSAGIDLEAAVSSLTRNGSVTTPPREGDLHVFGQLPQDQDNFDNWKTTTAGLAPYAEADFSLFDDKLHLIPGLRIEPQVVRVSRLAPPESDSPPVGFEREDTEVDPRFAVRWNVSKRVMAKAAVGIYHQPPFAEDLSSVFGNPKLGPANARQFLVGAGYKLSKPLSFEVTSFYSNSSDLAYRSPLPTPLRSQALLQGGDGRAYGTQFLLRHDLVDRFFGWVSLSIIRSERRDGPTANWRLFDFDQTFVFTVVGSYDLGAGFDVGSRFRYSSGYPRTPVVGADVDERVDGYFPRFGAQNSIRIPSFYALDVRGAKHFKFGEQLALELYLDVQNVTNHKNDEEIVYNYDYTKRSYITGMPILPVVGGKLSW
ncbi:MAG TPA: TonB-dependent receptor [Polyangiaceae bacterium]|nr:TonB-dependent receptor [Polyangiaceae bacterium]